MATVNTAAIASALQVNFEDDIENQINRASATLTMMGVQDARGQNITWTVRMGTVSAGSGAAISEGANVSTFNSDNKLPATLPYGTYHEAFGVTGKAISIAAASGNPQDLVNLFDEEIKEATERLTKALGEEIFNGDGTGERLVGLLGGALLASGTYAGIDRGTYPQWAGNVLANGGNARPLSLALMRAASRAAFIASGRRPNLIVCSPLMHDFYGGLIDPQRRYMQEVKMPSGVIKLDGGFRVLEFEGVPVVEDINCPDSQMLFLNTNFVRMRQLPQPNAMVTQSMGERQLVTTDDEVSSGYTQLRARIQPLAIAGDLYKFALYVYPQLQVRRPNSCTILKDLALS